MNTDAALIVARAFQYLGCWLVAGSLGFLVLIARQDVIGDAERQRVVRPLLASAWIGFGAAICSGALWLWVEIAIMGDTSLSSALPWDTIRSVLCDTHFGHVWSLRALLAAVLAGGLLNLRRSSGASNNALLGFNWFTATFFLGTIAAIGHAGASPASRFLLPIDSLHLMASGLWPGTLAPFTIFLLLARKSPNLFDLVPSITRRFSRVSLVVVAILGLTGVGNAFGLLPTLSCLWITRYGVILLIKLGLFALMLVFASLNLLRITPQMSADRQPDARLFRALLRNVGAEVLLGFGVAIAVGFLGVTPPPM